MLFTDIHTHIIAGVDDGSKDTAQMYALLDASYKDGARCICCTPHYHPGYYGQNSNKALENFHQLKKYAGAKYPDLQLFLGNELHYSQGCLEWVENGLCRTLNGTRYVLIDFESHERYQTIEFAIMSFLRRGYIPVLAHIERYSCFWRSSKLIKRLHDTGAIIQVNASSVLKMRHYPIIKKILQKRIVDVVASDAHNLDSRPPMLTAAYHEINKKYGTEYANTLFFLNPSAILTVQQSREVHENE